MNKEDDNGLNSIASPSLLIDNDSELSSLKSKFSLK
jgi:hypothetical protein